MTLDAVRNAALAQAAAEAEAVRRAALERKEQLLAGARDQAAAQRSSRRAAVEQFANLEEREALARVRAEAQATVLTAQRSVLLEAASAAREAVRRLMPDPRYQALLERLAADARERLAAAGPVEVAHVAGGGFIARAGTRQLDYSIEAQTERCLASMASELERLWE